MLLVIDTAKYQVGIDFNLPWAAGYRANYVKAGGDNSGRYVATGYWSNVDRSRAVGFRIGHYWVPDNAADPVGAADYFISILRGFDKARDFLVLDNESLDGATLYTDARAAAFVNRLKERLGIPGNQVLVYYGLAAARDRTHSAVLGTGANFIIAAYSYAAFAFPTPSNIPADRIVGHQTGGAVFGGVSCDINQFKDHAFNYGGSSTAGGGVTPIARRGDGKMFLAWAESTGYLVTEDGWHGLPSVQVYGLFYRLINSAQDKSPFAGTGTPEAFNRAEVDIMNSHLSLLRTANEVGVTVDPIKLAEAIRDALAVSGIKVTVEQLQGTALDLPASVLADAYALAAPRVARALVKQTGGVLLGLGGLL